MKTDITPTTIMNCDSKEELAAMMLTLQERLNATKEWLSDAKHKAAEGRGYAPSHLFCATEKEARDLGILIATVNERRGELRRLAHLRTQAQHQENATAKKELGDLLDMALKLLFSLYNDSLEDHFVDMLHESGCPKDRTCTCPDAKTFDKLMFAGGWAARSTTAAPGEDEL